MGVVAGEVAVGGTKTDCDCLRQQADEAGPMKQPPSAFVHDEPIVELENGHGNGLLVALPFAPLPGERHLSPTADDFA